MKQHIKIVALIQISILLLVSGQVLSQTDRVNHALNKSAEHWVDTWYNGHANYAVDGDSATASQSWRRGEANHWWQVDLEQSINIREIRITNVNLSAADFYVLVSDNPFSEQSLEQLLTVENIEHFYHQGSFLGTLSIPLDTTGRYVRIQANNNSLLKLGEVEIYDVPSNHTINPFDLTDGKLFSQSGDVWYNGHAYKAIDNNNETTANAWRRGSNQHWWQLDLRQLAHIGSIMLTTGSGGTSTLNEFYLFISQKPFGNNTLDELIADDAVYKHHQLTPVSGQFTALINTQARYVRIQLVGNKMLALSEFNIIGEDITADNDNDGIPNSWEQLYGLDPENPTDAYDDKDGDGVTNLTEFLEKLNPDKIDTDGDGFDDGGELAWGTWDKHLSLTENAGSYSIGGDSEEDKKILHILNRLTFGPTIDLYNEIWEAGPNVDDNIANWITAQFDTPGIEITYDDGVKKSEKQRRENNLYSESWVNQEGPESILPSDLMFVHPGDQNAVPPIEKDSIEACDFDFSGDLSKSPSMRIKMNNVTRCLKNYQEYCIANSNDPGQCMRDVHRRAFTNFDPTENGIGTKQYVANMAAIRPIHSNQHLRTYIGWFWDNHFNTDVSQLTGMTTLGYGLRENREEYETDTFYDNAFGNFYADLLLESARSTTMLEYLNNNESVAGDPNENYAREVMELHTMGVNGGYTQQDVYSLARIFTGWTIGKDSENLNLGRYKAYKNYSAYYGWYETNHVLYSNNGPTVSGAPSARYGSLLPSFKFDESIHDSGEKTFFNVDFQGSTEAEGEIALQMLAENEQTAHFLCTKLSRYLISDSPSAITIEDCADIFLLQNNRTASNQIELIISNLITSNEFNDPDIRRKKVKDIYEYVYGLSRLLNIETASLNFIDSHGPGVRLSHIGKITPYYHPSPDGRPENSAQWTSGDQITKRMAVLNRLLPEYIPDVTEEHPNFAFCQRLISKGRDRAYKRFCVERFNNYSNWTIDAFSAALKENIPLNTDSNEAKQVVQFLFKLMFGGYYTAADVQLAYNIMFPGYSEERPFGAAPFSLFNEEGSPEDFESKRRLVDLIKIMASISDFNLQ